MKHCQNSECGLWNHLDFCWVGIEGTCKSFISEPPPSASNDLVEKRSGPTAEVSGAARSTDLLKGENE